MQNTPTTYPLPAALFPRPDDLRKTCRRESCENGSRASVASCSMCPLVPCSVLSGVLTTWLFFLSTDTVYADELSGVTLELPALGTLRGSLNISAWTNRTIYQFQGIPFAKPPVGNLRFKVSVIHGTTSSLVS